MSIYSSRSNPILNAFRNTGKSGEIKGAGLWFVFIADDLREVGIRVTREHENHARRVLIRLAKFNRRGDGTS